MSPARILRATLALTVLYLLLGAAPTLAAEPASAPALALSSLATPTDFDQTKAGEYCYEVRVSNVGAIATDGSPITITDTLPEGLSVDHVELRLRINHQMKNFGIPFDPEVKSSLCKEQKPATVVTVTCTLPTAFDPGLKSSEEPSVIFPAEELRLVIFVTLPGTIKDGDKLVNEATVEGGGAPVATARSENEASAKDAPPGFAEFSASLTGPDGQPVTQAGSHPFQMTTTFALNLRHKSPGVEGPDFVPSGGDTKDIPIALPPGLVGNPTAAATCTLQQFNSAHIVQPFPENLEVQGQINDCPIGSAVGYIIVRRADEAGTLATPIFNLQPPPGMPAQFGFNVFGLPLFIDTEVRPEDNYQIVAGVHNINEAKRVSVGAVTLWGTPADPLHDPIRGHCLSPFPEFPISLAFFFPDCEIETSEKPSLRLPTDCSDPLALTASLDTWGDPGNFISRIATLPTPTGCNLLDFDPSLLARPTTNVADSPSGLSVNLQIPQNEDSKGLGEADARKVSMTLPPGLTVNPSGANGLEACSAAQIGRDLASPSGFDNEEAHCPDASKIGTVQVDTPLLEKPLKGSLFAAMPFENPFNSLLAVYLVASDPERGIVIKLAGEVQTDPQTGQLSTTFDELPQAPVGDFKAELFTGARAPLRTPAVCDTYSTTSMMTPWSAPESGPPAIPSDTYAISQSPDGSSCPTSPGALPNSPSFDAGTLSPLAGAYSPFVLHLRRADGSQEFASLSLRPPPGFTSKLAGIPSCSDAALAAAAAKSGAAEKADPSCPAASQIGTAEVGAGAGPAPYFVQGKIYLSGPYKGAPLSVAVITPATAGPFDVGTVVARAAAFIDPETAKITVRSDPLPTILQGIPLDVRSIAVKLDRPRFALNPTNCDPFSFEGELVSTLGQSAPLKSHFQVGECGRLPFKPGVSIRLKGGTKRATNPKLIGTVTAKEGEANVSSMSVKLPRSAFLDQSHIRTICTRVQFAADTCPKGSIYGKASLTTPLLDYPLSGNVYLRSSSHKLPDLVIDLRGPASQPIRVDLVGRTDAVKGALRTRFEAVPDAPFSKARVELFGGKRGLVVNSRNLCAHDYKATVKLQAQSGKALDTQPSLLTDCHKPKRHHKR